MDRKPNWEYELIRYIQRTKSVPFKVGVHDCVMFATDCIQAMTGEDLAEDIRGKYSTPIGAVKLCKKLGYSDVSEAISGRLPETSVPQPGDVAVFDDGEGYAPGILQSRQYAYVLTTSGYGLKPTTEAIKFFRV